MPTALRVRRGSFADAGRMSSRHGRWRRHWSQARASRRLRIGWALELHLPASLAVDVLKMAISARAPIAGSLIHHSDRGVQYACGSYSDILHAHGIQPSMSRVGNPYDNARAESFMKTLKQEEVAGLAATHGDVSPASLKTFTIGNDCIQRSITSPRRNTNSPLS